VVYYKRLIYKEIVPFFIFPVRQNCFDFLQQGIQSLKTHKRKTVTPSFNRFKSLWTAYRPHLVIGMAVVVTVVVYLPALKNDFVNWDDMTYVYTNAHIRSFGLQLFQWAFLKFFAWNWHPLTWISHGLDYAVWGLNPLGHHLTNILLHGVNTFLVGLLTVKLIESHGSGQGKPEPPEKTLSDKQILSVAAIACILFGVHPLHVESVAWISERKDLLCGLFFLLSLLAYKRYARDAGGSANSLFSNRHYLFSLCFFLLALLSKPMAVSLPLVMLILDWYPFNRLAGRNILRIAFLEKLPFFLLSFLSGVITIKAQNFDGSVETLLAIPFSTRILVGFNALISYLGKMIWPQGLIPFYPYPLNVSLLSYKYLLSVLLLVAITIVCFAFLRRSKIGMAVWAYYGVTLLPVLGFIQVGRQAMADRYMYLPSIGPFLLIGLGAVVVFEKITARRRGSKAVKMTLLSAGFFVVGILSYATVKQIHVWKDGGVLWTTVIETLSEKQGDYAYLDLPYHNRGLFFEKIDRYDEALRDYSQAIQISPGAPESYASRGFLFAKLGCLDDALTDYTQALHLQPDTPEVYYNRGNVNAKLGRLEDAVRDYTQAIHLSPRPHPDYYRNRGLVYKNLAKQNEAANDFLESEKLKAGKQ
jgi:tetratricopeptide (TPR) repeat protein